MVTTTARRTAGLEAACANDSPTMPNGPYTPATYWAFVYAHYRGPETEQQVYDRATDSYCRQFGLPVEGE